MTDTPAKSVAHKSGVRSSVAHKSEMHKSEVHKTEMHKPAPAEALSAMDSRTREVFSRLVDTYMRTGSPVGSRTLADKMGGRFSASTLRTVMADLESLGLLAAPHTSAGRLPTEHGLRLFVHGLMERDNLTTQERAEIANHFHKHSLTGSTLSGEVALQQASEVLSELSRCAVLVAVPAAEDSALRHVEFVRLSPSRVLMVLVTESGQVENRVLEVSPSLPASALVEAGNYISQRFFGRTFREATLEIGECIRRDRATLDGLTSQLVESGLAFWGGEQAMPSLLVSGHANLLSGVREAADVERIRALFAALERKESVLELLRLAGTADGVQIFIGAGSPLFGVAGCSVILAPWVQQGGKPVGALGVIGPVRLNYARIIPMVDYTAQVVRTLSGDETAQEPQQTGTAETAGS